jgi:PAS domain S-box-containing protein
VTFDPEQSLTLAADTARVLSQFAGHQRVLEAVMLRRPLVDVLACIVEVIESASPDVMGSVCLIDESGTRLLEGAAPRVPTALRDAVNGLTIGPQAGSCGTAAFTRAQVVVSDIDRDPLWSAFRTLALSCELRACWSTPIVDFGGRLLGTFAVYARVPRLPTRDELRVIEELTALACVAIQQAQAQSSLTRREAYYRALVDDAPSVILSLDGNGRILDTNPTALRLLAHSREALVGSELLTWCLPEARVRVAEWIAAAAVDAGTSMCDVPIVAPDGGVRWLLFSLACVAAGDAMHAPALLAIGQDITARVETETATRHSERALRESHKTEAVSRLAGGIAHDFNNLLTVIQGNAAIALQRADVPAELHDVLRDVERASERAAALTRQLLAFSQGDSTPLELLDLGDLVAGVHRLTTPLLGSAITVRFNRIDFSLPVKVVRAVLEAALSSLVLSARDAMPDGGVLDITVDSVMIDDTEAAVQGVRAGNFAQLRIRDSSRGMDEATRARAFEPFYLMPNAGSGGGLGLASLRALATRLSGALSLESAIDHGTTVTLLLPLTISATQGRVPSREMVAVPDGRTVLVVEDEDAVRQLMSRVLTNAGYRVLTATDGEDAVNVWRRHGDEVDIVVTDVVMPRLNGPMLVERLRVQRPGLPVVFCSGYSDAMPADLLDGAVQTAFLSKPFSLDGLTQLVARVLASSRGAPAGVG